MTTTANGDTLTGFAVSVRDGSIAVEVETTSRDTVVDTDQRTRAGATAEVRLEAGLCLRTSGFGLRLENGCSRVISAPDPVNPAPIADTVVEQVPAPPPPPSLTDQLTGDLRVTVRLVG